MRTPTGCYSMVEVAEMLGVTYEAISHKVKAGAMPSIHPSGKRSAYLNGSSGRTAYKESPGARSDRRTCPACTEPRGRYSSTTWTMTMF